MIDLSNLAEATEQEVFDQVKNHLLTQGVKCESDDTCLYRGENNLKCAAGCLIADHQYMPEMEENNWETLVEKGIVPSAHSDLIEALQKVHDTCTVGTWSNYLWEVAREFNLQY
jgi:hypothetical protein